MLYRCWKIVISALFEVSLKPFSCTFIGWHFNGYLINYNYQKCAQTRLQAHINIREDAYSRTAYFMRHTALSRTYAIVSYIWHNNNADSRVWYSSTSPLKWIVSAPDEVPVRMEPSHSPESLIQNTWMWKKWSATLMFVLSKAGIGLSTWLNEPRHCS